MVSYLEKLSGEKYPWSKYSPVYLSYFHAGAMENTSCTFFDQSLFLKETQSSYFCPEDYQIHELSHQWFGNLVSCESWVYIVLNESFASYCEYLWSEHQGLQGKKDKILLSFLSLYNEEKENNTIPIIRNHFPNPNLLFDDHTYSKGALVLHTLRSELGDSMFFDGIKQYIHTHKQSSVELDHLRLSFEQISGKDLHRFFNQWYMEKLDPVIEVSYKYKNNKSQIEIETTQKQKSKEPFEIESELVILYPEATVRKKLVIKNQKDKFYIPSDKEPITLFFDAEKHPLVTFQYKNTNGFDRALKNSETTLLSKTELLKQFIENNSNDSIKGDIILRAFEGSSENYRLFVSNYLLARDYDFAGPYKGSHYAALSNIVQNKECEDCRLAAIQLLNKFRNKGKKELLQKCLFDSNHDLVYYAMESLVNYYPEAAWNSFQALESSSDEEILQYLSYFYTFSLNDSHNQFYQRTILTANNQSNIIENYLYYLSTANDSLIQNAFDFLVQNFDQLKSKQAQNSALQFFNNIIQLVKEKEKSIKSQIKAHKENKSPNEIDQRFIDLKNAELDKLQFLLEYFNETKIKT